MIVFYCKLWNNADTLWKDANWKWSECLSADINPPGVDATTLVPVWQEEPWNPYKAKEEKQKRIVEIVCKINDINFNLKKEHKTFNLEVRDVKIIMNNSKNIDLKVEE